MPLPFQLRNARGRGSSIGGRMVESGLSVPETRQNAFVAFSVVGVVWGLAVGVLISGMKKSSMSPITTSVVVNFFIICSYFVGCI